MGGTRAGYWDGLIGEYRASGLSQVEFCRRRKISVYSLRAWLYQRDLRSARADLAAVGNAKSGADSKAVVAGDRPAVETGGAFLPIHVTADAAEPLRLAEPTAARLELLLANGRRVAVRPGFDAATLGQLLRALESSSQALPTALESSPC